MYYLEILMGQYTRSGTIKIWDICPIFRGVGIGITIMNMFVNVYFIIIMTWSMHFMFARWGLFTFLFVYKYIYICLYFFLLSVLHHCSTRMVCFLGQNAMSGGILKIVGLHWIWSMPPKIWISPTMELFLALKNIGSECEIFSLFSATMKFFQVFLAAMHFRGFYLEKIHAYLFFHGWIRMFSRILVTFGDQ